MRILIVSLLTTLVAAAAALPMLAPTLSVQMPVGLFAPASASTFTPTPVESVTSSPTQPASTSGSVYRVTARQDVALRLSPDVNAEVVDLVAAGESVALVRCSGDGIWCQTASGMWLMAAMLEPIPRALRLASAATPAPTLTTPTRTPPVTASVPVSATTSISLLGRLPTPTPTKPAAEQHAPATSAAQTPAATPTPTGARAAEAANLRAGPGTEFARVGAVAADASLDVSGRTESGEWYQLEDGAWIAAFLVVDAPVDLPVILDLPTPPVAPTDAPVVPPTSSPLAAEQAAPAAASVRSLVVEYINPHYECVQGEYSFEATPGLVEYIWAYRSFQVDMYITNLGTEPVAPPWSPTRWIITDGVNEMVNDHMWQWISRYSGRYEQPTIYPGQNAGWTWMAMPVGRNEWVKAVEFEYGGQLYRTEFDLGPYGNAHNYRDCGYERSHRELPTPTPRAPRP